MTVQFLTLKGTVGDVLQQLRGITEAEFEAMKQQAIERLRGAK